MSDAKKTSRSRLEHKSKKSLISNVLVLVIAGPLMGWVCDRLSNTYSRFDEPLPTVTAWFFKVPWMKLTVVNVLLAAALIVMERKVHRPRITLTIHLLVTVALGVLIGAFIYAMLQPMLAMVNQTGFS